MVITTDQLLSIAKATGSKIHTRESEAESDSRVGTLVLSLKKQYNAQYYRFYEKGTTRAMVGLQGLHNSDAFRHSNVSSSIRLKSFCCWCFKLEGNTETIDTHLWEVPFSVAIVCDICKAFASMSVKAVLEHCAGCKTKSHRKESKAKDQEKA